MFFVNGKLSLYVANSYCRYVTTLTKEEFSNCHSRKDQYYAQYTYCKELVKSIETD